MEDLYYYFALLLFVLIIKYMFYHNQKLPPSPLALPIIGHLHLIKTPLHHTFSSLSSQYGPILFLRFGYRSIVVVSSPTAIEECFTKNDIVFSNRPRTLAGDTFTYNYAVFVWTSYGHLWRSLRRLAVVELFSSNGLQKSSIVCEQEAQALLRQLFKASTSGSPKVELNYWFSILTFNSIMRLVAGKWLVREEDAPTEMGKKILEEFRGTFFVNVSMNVCDFFPILRLFGYKGLERSMISLQRQRDEFLQGLVDEFRQRKTNSSNTNTMRRSENKTTLIETLLSLQESEPDLYSDAVIKSIMLVMLVGGTETSALTMEWAMSLLLAHPEALQKVRAEMDNHVGHGRLLTDRDLAKLPYLQCVINETLRLYPPTPLLLPRYSSEDSVVGGFQIPRGTTLMVNAWALHRDPKMWEEPHKFRPERFEAFEAEMVEREKVKFVPFGMGRRACPGANVAMRTVSLALGSLVQCFEWEKVGEDRMDVDYNSRVTLQKAKPLEAVCIPRQESIHLLSQL